MVTETTCTLPGGLWDAAELHRDAELTALTGREEELLADRSAGAAALVTTLLSRCVLRLGTHRPVTEDLARGLLVGDRQYLLLKLRQLTFGDRIEAVVRCPWPDCGEPVDVDFLVSQIAVKEASGRSRLYAADLPAAVAAESGLGDEAVRVHFRLPTGADQEVLSPALARNEGEALTLLLARCIERIGESTATADLVQRLSPSARLDIERAMEAAAPGVELTMEAKCPQCGRAFAAPFDAQDFILGEARGNADLLMREIHYLAYHYHWSERDILSMPRDRRRAYIGILADEMDGMNNAAA